MVYMPCKVFGEIFSVFQVKPDIAVVYGHGRKVYESSQQRYRCTYRQKKTVFKKRGMLSRRKMFIPLLLCFAHISSERDLRERGPAIFPLPSGKLIVWKAVARVRKSAKWDFFF